MSKKIIVTFAQNIDTTLLHRILNFQELVHQKVSINKLGVEEKNESTRKCFSLSDKLV